MLHIRTLLVNEGTSDGTYIGDKNESRLYNKKIILYFTFLWEDKKKKNRSLSKKSGYVIIVSYIYRNNLYFISDLVRTIC